MYNNSGHHYFFNLCNILKSVTNDFIKKFISESQLLIVKIVDCCLYESVNHLIRKLENVKTSNFVLDALQILHRF